MRCPVCGCLGAWVHVLDVHCLSRHCRRYDPRERARLEEGNGGVICGRFNGDGLMAIAATLAEARERAEEGG